MRARIFQLADMAGKQGRKLTSADRNGTRAGIFNLAEMASLRRTTEHLDGRLKTCTFSEAQFQESFEGTADPDCDARPGNTDHLEIFFADYPSFHYNPFMPISAQYMALCLLYGFYRGEPDSNKAYAGFQRAMAQTFSDIFGSNVDDLGNLQSLCRLLGVDPIPGNIKECRKAVRGVHVNLVDLVDWGRMGSAIHRFETEQDLAEYTRTSQKYFPQGEAEGSLLQFLLRRII
ncbi:hypothetical protein DFH06DRAFT_1166616 [Mycena polygramma]|nr:hypothetical protein DFH06DRAFT_1166616 [Mycena polygramma]